jgi:hypothetical protein
MSFATWQTIQKRVTSWKALVAFATLRWGRGGQGKSGGVRVIYYFYDDAMPLYLLTLFAKGDQANLSQAQRNELAGLVKLLVQTWKRKPS